jgi:hypothetical protein
MSQLFDSNIERTSNAAGNAEGRYAFLNRSSWADVAAIRTELERWFADYPEEGRHDLQRRFQSADEGQHIAAWWELYLYRLFTQLGFRLEPHPDVAGTTKHPDFRVTDTDGSTFLLEAVTTRSGIVRDDERHEGRENVLLDAINQVKSGAFGVSAEVTSVGESSIKTKPIRQRLAKWLEKLDPNDAKWDGDVEDEDFVIDQDGWLVTLTPFRHGDWPNPEPDPDDRLIGIGPLIVGMVNDAERLRGALQSKRKRYGTLGEPYVIAVLSEGFGIKDDDVLSVLLGSLAVAFTPGEHGSARMTRQDDGVWLRHAGPAANNITAVLIASSLFPWTAARDLPTLWPNPWADHPLEVELPFALGRIEPGNLSSAAHEEAKRAAADIFGLAADWPGNHD